MTVKVEASALKETRWYEYLVRFGFGGGISVAAGVIGHHFGPLVGGLFLAFPAILPASLTLVDEHDGRAQAADDAAGAVCGGAGLVAFALVMWLAAGRMPAALALGLASAAWIGVSLVVWRGSGLARRSRR